MDGSSSQIFDKLQQGSSSTKELVLQCYDAAAAAAAVGAAKWKKSSRTSSIRITSIFASHSKFWNGTSNLSQHWDGRHSKGYRRSLTNMKKITKETIFTSSFS